MHTLPRKRPLTTDLMSFSRAALCRVLAPLVVVAGLALSSPLHAAQTAIKGPYITTLSDSDATVRFELATAGPATVEVTAQAGAMGDASATRPSRFESREVSTMHRVRVTGLQPATPYALLVRAAGAVIAEGRIVTAPRPDASAPLSFLVYGDDRTDEAAHASVVRAMSATASDFLVNTGDMVSDGASSANWQTFFDIEKPLLKERALFSAIGNHELYDDAAGTNFARYFGFPDESGVVMPYGTVRFGNARFFFLNGMDDWSSGEERQWLERELSRADGEAGLAWRFAVLHHGPWSAGPHGPNTKLLEAGVPQLLASHKVDLLFAGHDHLYERGDAGVLKYIVSGGGGAPLYRDIHDIPTTRKAEAAHHFVEVTLRGNALQTVARRADGSVLDRCGFVQGGAWDCDAPRGVPAPAASKAASVAPPPSPPSHGCACSEPASARGEGGAAAPIVALAAVLLGRSRRRG
jgi:acid phosphatase type 7